MSAGLSQRTADDLGDARPLPVWWEGRDVGPVSEPVARTSADLVIVGGGLTGLWAAVTALQESPGRDVLVLDAAHVAAGASGRNGGFFSTSLTHGLAHGHATWPSEMPTLLRLGHENVAETAALLAVEGIEADLRLVGKTAFATRPHEAAALRASADLHERYGEAATFLDAVAARADVDSPTYLAGLRTPSGGLVDPVALTTGLRDLALRRGARLHEGTRVTRFRRASGARVTVTTDRGEVTAQQVLVATNAHRPPLARLRAHVLPVWDHVLATEPLSDAQLDALGWAQRQGLTDAGNQFHYYRLTPARQLLWGGYDAIYYYGGDTSAAREQRDTSHRLLARQFRTTFPQLADARFTHRWAGVIDTTSRFTPVFGTALGGALAYAVGYTGLGVASSRFGARVALDLLAGRETERTALAQVRRKPIPFPPEPLRSAAVQTTRAALAREDATGRTGLLLRTLARFGVGFSS